MYVIDMMRWYIIEKLLWRTHLDPAVPHGTEEALTLRGDVAPFPLKQVRDGVTSRGTGRVTPGPPADWNTTTKTIAWWELVLEGSCDFAEH